MHLIAVDTVLTPLLRSGIVPDFVVTLDAGFFNALDFRVCFIGHSPPGDIHLVADIVSHPLIPSHWGGPLFFSSTTTESGDMDQSQPGALPLLEHCRGSFPHFDSLACGGSISTTAIELALLMGARPVYVTGLDLSYTDFKTHVNSTPQYDELYRAANRLDTLHTAMIRGIGGRELERLPAIEGRADEDAAMSDFVFSGYLRWIENRRQYRGRVVNCTARGVAIPGINHRRLEALAATAELPEEKGKVGAAQTRALSRSNALEILSTLSTAIDSVRGDLQAGMDWNSLAERNTLFCSLIFEAHRIHGSSPSLYRHIDLLLEFMERHVRRSETRIMREAEA
jgi:hypothetical protein